MKKTFSLVAVFIMTLFVLPFANTALAEESNYDDIKDGEYDITAKALHADKDEASGAASFINEDATLSVQDGTFELTITIPDSDIAEIKDLQIEGVEPTKDGESWTYILADLTSELNAQVHYVVPSMGMDHKPELRFALEGLDDLPVIEEEPEEEDSEEAPEEREVGNLVTQDESDAVYELNYETDSNATEQQLENPIKLLEKSDKKYIQIPIKESGAQFFRSLQINGKEVIWNSITEGPYTIQFELPNGVEDELDMSMVIQPPGMDAMPHDDIKLWFDEDSIETIKEKPEEEVKTKTETETIEFDTVEKEDSSLEKGQTKVKQKGVKGTNEITYEVTYKNGEETDRKVISEKVTKEPVDKIILIGTKEVAEKKDLAPDKAFEVDYVINHEDGTKPSISNDFFEKPAYLFEKDGKKYIQLTIENGDMIKDLSNKHGKALVVKKNQNGSIVVQLRVDNNLADMLLDMHIIVPSGAIPGFPGYNNEHEAILVLDKDSLVEVDASKYSLVPGSKDNKNGPIVEGSTPGEPIEEDDNGNGVNDETPTKPTFDPNNGDDNGTNGAATNKTDNPKTGDTSQVLLFSLLLIGSLTPLAIKARRRFV